MPVIISPETTVVLGTNQVSITGEGIPGHTVVITVDDLTAASVVIPQSGMFEVRIPPLAAGVREVRAYQISSSGRKSRTSAPIVFTVMEAAPLDFVGYGRTAVTTWRTAGASVSFKIRDVSGGAWRTTAVPGRYPAPGDYDGDGVTDLAAVGEERGLLVWTIHRSAGGNDARVILGDRGDSILTGCRLLNSSQTTIAVFAQKRRRIVFQKIDGTVQQSVGLYEVRRGDLIGCGDINADGVDEVLFKVPGDEPRGSRIVAYDTGGKLKLSKDFDTFVRGYVVRTVGSAAPLVAVLKGTIGRGIPIKVSTLAGTFSFPLFFVAGGSTIATGLFETDDNQQVPGVLWSEPRTRTIFYRVFRKQTSTIPLYRLPHGYELLRSSNVFRTRG